jgi:DNA-binding LacI/PurR family transcriptional regulator
VTIEEIASIMKVSKTMVSRVMNKLDVNPETRKAILKLPLYTRKGNSIKIYSK